MHYINYTERKSVSQQSGSIDLAHTPSKCPQIWHVAKIHSFLVTNISCILTTVSSEALEFRTVCFCLFVNENIGGTRDMYFNSLD